MQLFYVKGKKIVKLENNEQITINYCLVEEQEVRSKPLYGIKLIQENGSGPIVSEYTEPLSYSKAYVENILEKLIENNVFISNFIETVDDLVV